MSSFDKLWTGRDRGVWKAFCLTASLATATLAVLPLNSTSRWLGRWRAGVDDKLQHYAASTMLIGLCLVVWLRFGHVILLAVLAGSVRLSRLFRRVRP